MTRISPALAMPADAMNPKRIAKGRIETVFINNSTRRIRSVEYNF
jgi:hypothetical protein